MTTGHFRDDHWSLPGWPLPGWPLVTSGMTTSGMVTDHLTDLSPQRAPPAPPVSSALFLPAKTDQVHFKHFSFLPSYYLCVCKKDLCTCLCMLEHMSLWRTRKGNCTHTANLLTVLTHGAHRPPPSPLSDHMQSIFSLSHWSVCTWRLFFEFMCGLTNFSHKKIKYRFIVYNFIRQIGRAV